MGRDTAFGSSGRRSVGRIVVGSVAVALFFLGQGIASQAADDAAWLGGLALALTLHGLAAALVFVFFFKRRRTRVRSRVPLAEAPLEMGVRGAGDRVRRELARLTARLGWTYAVLGLMFLLAAFILVLVDQYGGSVAGLVVEARGGLMWLALLVFGGTISCVTAYGLLTSRSWRLIAADTTGFLFSAGFPIGTAFALYTWWVTRTLRGALNASEPIHPAVTSARPLSGTARSPLVGRLSSRLHRGIHAPDWWRLVVIAFALGFGYFVWPTPWRYDRFRGANGMEAPIRANRFTGRTQILLPQGWRHWPKPRPYDPLDRFLLDDSLEETSTGRRWFRDYRALGGSPQRD